MTLTLPLLFGGERQLIVEEVMDAARTKCVPNRHHVETLSMVAVSSMKVTNVPPSIEPLEGKTEVSDGAGGDISYWSVKMTSLMAIWP